MCEQAVYVMLTTVKLPRFCFFPRNASIDTTYLASAPKVNYAHTYYFAVMLCW